MASGYAKAALGYLTGNVSIYDAGGAHVYYGEDVSPDIWRSRYEAVVSTGWGGGSETEGVPAASIYVWRRRGRAAWRVVPHFRLFLEVRKN